jgi:hypothetical protein
MFMAPSCPAPTPGSTGRASVARIFCRTASCTTHPQDRSSCTAARLDPLATTGDSSAKVSPTPRHTPPPGKPHPTSHSSSTASPRPHSAPSSPCSTWNPIRDPSPKPTFNPGLSPKFTGRGISRTTRRHPPPGHPGHRHPLSFRVLRASPGSPTVAPGQKSQALALRHLQKQRRSLPERPKSEGSQVAGSQAVAHNIRQVC